MVRAQEHHDHNLETQKAVKTMQDMNIKRGLSRDMGIEKLKKEGSEMHAENRKLQQQVDTLKAIMIEFDTRRIEEATIEENCIVQLMKENQALRDLLLIHENHGVMAADIENAVKEAEEKVIVVPSLPSNPLADLIDNSDDEEEGDNHDEDFQMMMPKDVKDVIQSRQIVKEHEKRVN